MRVWLVTIGEPVPTGPGASDRLHRTGYFAGFLAGHGHEVTWWTSTFDHFRKQHRFEDDATIHASENLEIRLLRGCGYKSNVSLARFRDHAQIGRKYARLARAEREPPEIIVAALPTIELSLESVKYGTERGIPVVLDMRDMWPDIFAHAVPKLTRPLARCLFLPMFRSARAACAKATAIIGITEAFVDWGVRRGGRARTEFDRAFSLAYTSSPPPPDRVRIAERYWQERGVAQGTGPMNVAFIGALGGQYDLETVIRTARTLSAQSKPIRFIICGAGDHLEQLKRMAANLPNVIFPGWVDAAAIYVLMRSSSVGLDPIPDRFDYLASINNKAIEYLSAGLPVISSPNRGVLAALLAQEACGLCYDPGDAGALADILLGLLGRPEVLHSMSANALALFQDQFRAEKVYGEMAEHLERIRARNQTTAGMRRAA